MIIDFLLGTACVSVPYNTENFEKLTNTDIQFKKIMIDKGRICFELPLYKLRVLKKAFAEDDFAIISVKGIPKIVLQYRKRWGALIGLIIASVIIAISSDVIWCFNITGNETVDDDTIISTLNKLNCHIGSSISNIDFDLLCNDFLVECPDVAWISVNMDGTHANVEIKETVRGNPSDNRVYNIVASSDGQIAQITAYSGKKEAAIGDVVRKGQLLISAVGSYGEGRNHIESADGLVLAEVYRSFSVDIPMETDRKVYSGAKTVEKGIKFFDFYINLSVNSRIPYAKYDKIVEYRQIVLLDTVELPLWYYKECFSEYMIEKSTLSVDEAKRLALITYKNKLRRLSEKAEIVSIVTSHSVDNGSYVINCSLYCIEDIAKAQPIEIK